MLFPTRSLAVLLLALAPVIAHAELYKCVSANGTAIFADRPCVTGNGEKSAEIKDDAAFAAALARENAKNVALGCMTLERRIAQCRAGLDHTLAANLREHCRPPVLRFQQAQRASRDQDDRDHYRDYRDLPPDGARCEALQGEAWSFVKANFSKKMSERDMKTIEYNLAAVPSDGHSPDMRVRRRITP